MDNQEVIEQAKEELRYWKIIIPREESINEVLTLLESLSSEPKTEPTESSHDALVAACENGCVSLTIALMPKLNDNVAGNREIITIVISSLRAALAQAKKE